jgi:hypothetical protein
LGDVNKQVVKLPLTGPLRRQGEKLASDTKRSNDRLAGASGYDQAFSTIESRQSPRSAQFIPSRCLSSGIELESTTTATGFAATGFAATGFAATGFAATGFAATGFAATGFAATGFAATTFTAVRHVTTPSQERKILRVWNSSELQPKLPSIKHF